MIAGKGHEQGQEFEDGRKIPFDDVTVVREILRRDAGGAGASGDEAVDSPAGRRRRPAQA